MIPSHIKENPVNVMGHNNYVRSRTNFISSKKNSFTIVIDGTFTKSISNIGDRQFVICFIICHCHSIKISNMLNIYSKIGVVPPLLVINNKCRQLPTSRILLAVVYTSSKKFNIFIYRSYHIVITFLNI